jgi:hypothetical protein
MWPTSSESRTRSPSYSSRPARKRRKQKKKRAQEQRHQDNRRRRPPHPLLRDRRSLMPSIFSPSSSKRWSNNLTKDTTSNSTAYVTPRALVRTNERVVSCLQLDRQECDAILRHRWLPSGQSAQPLSRLADSFFSHLILFWRHRCSPYTRHPLRKRSESSRLRRQRSESTKRESLVCGCPTRCNAAIATMRFLSTCSSHYAPFPVSPSSYGGNSSIAEFVFAAVFARC